MSLLVRARPETSSIRSTRFARVPDFNESQLQDAILPDVTLPFVEAFVLQKPGDYCIVKNLKGQMFLSMLSWDDASIVHLPMRESEDGFGIRGLLFARAQNLALLFLQLHKNLDILSGVVDKRLKFERLMTYKSVEVHNIHFDKKVTNVQVLKQSVKSIKYTGDIKMADGSVREALFEEEKYVDGDFIEKFFENLVTVASLTSKNLPIRLPIAAFLRQPTFIFEKDTDGIPLDLLLKHHQLDLTQRIKLCTSAVRVMSDLHHCDIFHGAVQPANFFASFVEEKEGVRHYELVFNGAGGLLFNGKSSGAVDLLDYDMMAPEIAFTRKLSKESGVFNMGRLFEQILKPEILKTYENGAIEDPVLREIRQLIARATRANPIQRPTMNGIVMVIRETLKDLPPSHSTINFIHFDQFRAD